eukprot:gnl/TRDRNA2_/TRDRNA2_177222_c0_seq3.p1 gnl/TRDRNA2_/TRDRNA2_177222_c0~~gnl/TRDRNA2_/TRDRNA2_177222_c0_seq3.p1  ORF type:complete len:132 (+),score=47.61 gnl/TRDRNA2_/TRDRNA2_177222_c0_seq3:2-397(+)
MLEVIESDFARLQSDTESGEATAVSEYKKFLADSDEDKSLKKTESDHKDGQKTDAQTMLQSTHATLEQTQVELSAALDYFEKLKPDCVDSGIDAEERIKKRNEEIESLTEAYKIISGEELPSIADIKAESV